MPGLYIGKAYDSVSRQLGAPVHIDSADFTTHGIVIGMTGSGKTGLSVCIIEELLRARVPVIVVDPKGDMTNLALAFDRLAPEQFEPWVDAADAARSGKSAGQAAAEAAAAWTEGLASWDITPADVAAYANGRDLRIYTPGASAGISLNVIDSLAWPGLDFEENEEELRDEIDAIVGGLLGFIKVDADPLSSREYILLANLIEHAWRNQQDLTLELLVGQVASPPLEKVGALPLEAFYPQADRNKLMFALNNLVASPRFEAWREGEPIDIEGWVNSSDGSPRLSIVYTAHLDDDERIFVTSLLLNKLKTWMRKQPGTSELRCLFYMDEIFGYFPPTANPPTKKPLLTLLKQARAYGLGVLLSTQNPVDLDYKGLGNMGFWAIGRLQTTQDQERVRQGIEAALESGASSLDFADLIAAVEKRVFLVHDIHRPAPELVHSRWAMSYLRGPLTRDEIARLPEDMITTTGPHAVPSPADRVADGAAPGTTAKATDPALPFLPPPLVPRFVSRFGATAAAPYLWVKAAVRYKAGGVTSDEQLRELAFRLDVDTAAGQALEREPIVIAESEIRDAPPPGISFAQPPAFLNVDGARGIERLLAERLDDRLQIDILYDAKSRQYARLGESPGDFAARLSTLARESSTVRTLEARLETKRAELIQRRDDLSALQTEKWAGAGATILGNLGLFGRRSRRSLGSAFSKSRSESSAERAIARLETEIANLERRLAESIVVDTTRFESRLIRPARGDISILRYEIVWVS